MSLSSDVKEKIVNILDDGQLHSVSQIKDTIRAESDKEISENIFTNCLSKLLAEKKCINPERGKYMKNKETNTTDDRGEVKYKSAATDHGMVEKDKISVADYNKIKTVIDQSIIKMEKEFSDVMELYNLGKSDTRLIIYCLEIRERFNIFKKDIDEINQKNEK